jgi:hypothetical protein
MLGDPGGLETQPLRLADVGGDLFAVLPGDESAEFHKRMPHRQLVFCLL